MIPGTYRWLKPGWIPELEVVRCARLEKWRGEHEKVLAALLEAIVGEADYRERIVDGEPQRELVIPSASVILDRAKGGSGFVALDELLGVVESAFKDLQAHHDEIGVAIDDAAEKVTPELVNPHLSMPLANDDPEAKEQGEREQRERAKLRPRREALDRDVAALVPVRQMISFEGPQVLYQAGVLPETIGQVRELRDELEAVAVP